MHVDRPLIDAGETFQPNEPDKISGLSAIVISKGTTYFTELLTREGHVDYAAAIDRYVRLGVDRE